MAFDHNMDPGFESELESELQTGQHAANAHHSQGSTTSQERYYSGQWRAVISSAKEKVKLSMVTKSIFPSSRDAAVVCRDALAEATFEHEQSGSLVEGGTYITRLHPIQTHQPSIDTYDPVKMAKAVST